MIALPFRRTLLLLLAVSSLASCGGGADECSKVECASPPAISLSVTTAAGGPVEGAFVDITVNGRTVDRVECPTAGETSCLLGGGPGAYHLEIGAPGYVTVVRDVEVELGARDGCCGGGPVTAAIDVKLEPLPPG